MLKSYLISTVHQKILDFFIIHPDKSFYGTELAKENKLSLGATNKALRDFFKDGLLEKEKKGKTDLYSLKDQQPIIRQLKILNILLRLEPLIEELKPVTHKIILYGSSSRGDNDSQSDTDLLIVTNNTNKPDVEDKIYQYQRRVADLPKMQATIKTTIQWTDLEKNDPTYFHEILKGLTLWDSLQSYV